LSSLGIDEFASTCGVTRVEIGIPLYIINVKVVFTQIHL
jgi:hypothetical protein